MFNSNYGDFVPISKYVINYFGPFPYSQGRLLSPKPFRAAALPPFNHLPEEKPRLAPGERNLLCNFAQLRILLQTSR